MVMMLLRWYLWLIKGLRLIWFEVMILSSWCMCFLLLGYSVVLIWWLLRLVVKVDNGIVRFFE